MALIAAEKAIAVMETATGSCPVGAVYVRSVFWFGCFAALSQMLSNTSPEMLPRKYSYVSISHFNTLVFSP